jgi:hypothetical protein
LLFFGLGLLTYCQSSTSAAARPIWMTDIGNRRYNHGKLDQIGSIAGSALQSGSDYADYGKIVARARQSDGGVIAGA